MQKTYIIDHATKKVTSNDCVCRGVTLAAYNSRTGLYALHHKGHGFFGGQGQRQSYAPAEITVYQPTQVQQIDNSKELIYVGTPVLRWYVSEQGKTL